jgi:hypothetical protein
MNVLGAWERDCSPQKFFTKPTPPGLLLNREKRPNHSIISSLAASNADARVENNLFEVGLGGPKVVSKRPGATL